MNINGERRFADSRPSGHVDDLPRLKHFPCEIDKGLWTLSASGQSQVSGIASACDDHFTVRFREYGRSGRMTDIGAYCVEKVEADDPAASFWQ